MTSPLHETKRDVYVTGFGKFGDILENPTTLLAQQLKGDANVVQAEVIETSADGEELSFARTILVMNAADTLFVCVGCSL